ncbi:hypothetical protein LWI29_038251 [Acer saccharum]|uniref:Response regulatory domain-containing protein n=1 Tax=Acer saccharum TaxID=4024 RepID=A0AA39S1W3_ACESA|nr:hypothetical protein LWI29_038251 [Acer saccharum]
MNKIKALVVDDNMVNQTIHHRLLENLGIENQVVRNGKEAVDVHSSGKYFDLILMDMDMPIMNGIEIPINPVGAQPPTQTLPHSQVTQ